MRYTKSLIIPFAKMKKTFLILFLAIHTLQASAQMKLLPKFVRRMYFSKDTSKRGSFVILPVLSSAPETGIEVGGAGLYSFYTDTTDRSTRVSNIFGYATLTTKGQNRLNLSTSYWSPKNITHYSASIGFINFPFNFYGLGNNTHLNDQDYVSEKRYRINFGAEKSLGNHIYAGFVAGGYNYAFSDDNTTGIFYTNPAIEDRNGGTVLYVGPSLNFDNRNNNTYTTKGISFTSYLNVMHGVLGSNNYVGSLFNAEYTQFISFGDKLVLGIDILEQSLIGNQSPFYLLPQMGSSELMRGYYSGRYRDRNYAAGQAELRYRFIKKVAIVGFIGTGEVFHDSFTLPELKPNLGGGIRYFFDIEKGLSVRVDYGVGEKPTGEKRQSGLYIGLGQAF
jgi:hypothetical protein